MLKEIRGFTPRMVLLVLFMFFNGMLHILISLELRDIVDSGVSGNSSAEGNIITFVLMLMLLFVVSIITNFMSSKFIKYNLKKLKSNYLKGIFDKNINEFKGENNALYISNLTNDYNLIETELFEPLLGVISAVVTFISGVIIISIVSPFILLVGVLVIVINSIISILVSKPLNKQNKERSEMFSKYTIFVKEVLSAFHIIKANELTKDVKSNFYQKSEEVQNKKYIIDRIQSIVFAFNNLNANLAFYAFIIIVSYMAINGTISFGEVVLVINSVERIVSPTMVISEGLPRIMSVKSIFTRIKDSLLSDNHNETIGLQEFKNDIVFNDVDFSFEDNEILKGLNLKFEKDRKYLIVGPSGGGKSTLLKLLRKYFNPKSGNILIDGKPLKDVKKEEYFSLLANVEQNVFLFEDTLKNNLTLYKNYDEEELLNAINKAGLNDFLETLPDGLDTILYDNGKNISGGERSRIAIVRGLISKAQIIFLDEAFASLDSEKAKEIERSILDLNNVTIINVSHVVFKEHQSEYDNLLIVKDKTVEVN
ncbi:ABC transporter ATP-binding protein [Mycoplasmatota bacterium zrk1]